MYTVTTLKAELLHIATFVFLQKTKQFFFSSTTYWSVRRDSS